MTTVRRYHAELDETRERFTGLMQHTADAVYVSEFSVGGTGQFVDVNPGACEMLGYTREELLQRGPADIVSKTTAAEMPALIQRLRDEGHLLIETEHVARDGVALPVEVHATVVTLGGAGTCSRSLAISLIVVLLSVALNTFGMSWTRFGGQIR
jgi:PAS domain S-box-containing protein